MNEHDENEKRKPRPPHGMKRLGPFTCRRYLKPHSGYRGGDLLVRKKLGDGSIALLVGDVVGHGEPAALLGRGIPGLFRSLCEKMPMPVNIELLKSQLDHELEKVMEDGTNIQATLIHLRPDGSHWLGVIHPRHAVVAPPKPVTPPTRAVARTTLLLGTGTPLAETDPGDVLTFPFPSAAELVVATDGLFEQPGRTPQRHFDRVIQNVEGLDRVKSLFSQILFAHKQDVKVNDKGQEDDVLVVSLRPTTDEEAMVFGLREGNAAAVSAFVQRVQQSFRNLVQRLRHDRDDPDDIMQELLLHLYIQIRKFRHGDFQSWMATCARNFLYSRLKQKKTQSRPTAELSNADERDATPASKNACDDPALITAIKDRLKVYISRLPEPKQQFFRAVVSHSYETLRDLCQSLGIPRHVGKRWCRELRKVILDCLE